MSPNTWLYIVKVIDDTIVHKSKNYYGEVLRYDILFSLIIHLDYRLHDITVHTRKIRYTTSFICI